MNHRENFTTIGYSMSEYHKIADQWLILKYQSGDKKALEILVKKWHSKLLYHAYRLIGDKDIAKDIVQDSWATIIRKIENLQDPQRFPFWANRIVHNKCVDWIRKQQVKRKKEGEMKLDDMLVITGSEEENKEQNIQMLIKALSTLPESQKLILTLFYLREQSVKEISLILNIPTGTVKSRLFNAREHLKNILNSR